MPAISLRNLTKRFTSFVAVNDLSFEVAKNHVVGFLGPNGAGKTTTLRMLVGLSKPTGGEMSVSDVPVMFGNAKSNLKVGYLPESPSFYSWMSGREYLEFIAGIFQIPTSARAIKIDELLELVDLTKAQKRRISGYSGGMKQRLGIAQALVNDPEVLILDEPVSALDPFGRKEVLETIERLKENRTVFFSTHILSDVDRICDDVVIIDNGALIVSKPLAELKAEFSTPILEIEFISDPARVAKIASQEKWVKKSELNGNSLKLWLRDGADIERNIPFEFFARQDIGILKYGVKLPETEDLFMELLGEKSE
jgi:ABC-2 type transport system ATP-binding protein